MVFLELRQEAWGSSGVATGTSGNLSCCHSGGRPPSELQWVPQDSYQVAARESQVVAGNSGLLSSCDRDLRIPIKFQQGSRPHFVLRHGTPLSSRVLKGVSGLLSS